MDYLNDMPPCIRYLFLGYDHAAYNVDTKMENLEDEMVELNEYENHFPEEYFDELKLKEDSLVTSYNSSFNAQIVILLVKINYMIYKGNWEIIPMMMVIIA